MMYRCKEWGLLVQLLRGKGSSPFAEECHIEFVSICARQQITQFHFWFPFFSMHPNELNTILKYGRALMRKNERYAHLSHRFHCLVLPPLSA